MKFAVQFPLGSSTGKQPYFLVFTQSRASLTDEQLLKNVVSEATPLDYKLKENLCSASFFTLLVNLYFSSQGEYFKIKVSLCSRMFKLKSLTLFCFSRQSFRLKHSQFGLIYFFLLLNEVFLSGIPAVNSRWW